MPRLYKLLHAALALIGFGLCAWAYPQLPEAVPSQYGLDGSVNRTGGPEVIWLVWGLWVAVALLLEFVRRNPDASWINVGVGVRSVTDPALLALISFLPGLLMLGVLTTLIVGALGTGAFGLPDIPPRAFTTAMLVAGGAYVAVVMGLAIRASHSHRP